MTEKHTKLPWIVEKFADTRSHLIYGDDGFSIAEVTHRNSPETQTANANFICLAVNHHQALVKALRRVINAFGCLCPTAKHTVAVMQAKELLAEIKEAKR